MQGHGTSCASEGGAAAPSSYLAFLLSFSPLLATLSARTNPFRTTVHSSTFLYELGGNTPLHLACQEGDEDSMELILTAIGHLSPLSPSPLSCPPAYPSAASIDGSPLTSLAAAPNDAGLTPLDLLVLASHVPDWRHQQLLDRYSALLVGSGEEVEDKARFAGPRRL